MRSHYDSIYLAPHLDDAALSCGGQINAQTAAGKAVLIVSVMAGDPPAKEPVTDFVRSLHERWELVAETVARRRAEDVDACRILGADHLHWDVPDCVYRIHPGTGDPLYVTEESLFGEVHEAETALIAAVAEMIRDLPAHGRIFIPLTVGNHVDHQITRRAAETVQGANLIYYEDFPYVGEAQALEEVIPIGVTGWESETIPLSEVDLKRKIEAIAAFVSQLSTFFSDRADLEEQIEVQCQQVGGERVWRRLNNR
jgi:LmbE family N-acetylglucosaminyl deacetylase